MLRQRGVYFSVTPYSFCWTQGEPLGRGSAPLNALYVEKNSNHDDLASKDRKLAKFEDVPFSGTNGGSLVGLHVVRVVPFLFLLLCPLNSLNLPVP